MATPIINSFSAIVPAVYGTATPVIDVGSGAGSVNAVAALTEAGSVVVNLGSPPSGAVTYTASGLAHEMSVGSAAPPAAASEQTKPSTSTATGPVPVEPPMLGQVAQDARSNPAPVLVSTDRADGVYDNSGAFKASAGAAASLSGSVGALLTTSA